VIVRCTAKTFKLLGIRALTLPVIEPADDDWYVNLLWLDRRKCLLVTHAGTLFSVFMPTFGMPTSIRSERCSPAP
jgi:hypothetical protein